MHATEAETHKARKAHRCEWCGQRIDEGTAYKRYRYYDGGEASTVKMHPECYDAMQGAAREEGGYIEWTPGMERPLPANDCVCAAERSADSTNKLVIVRTTKLKRRKNYVRTRANENNGNSTIESRRPMQRPGT